MNPPTAALLCEVNLQAFGEPRQDLVANFRGRTVDLGKAIAVTHLRRNLIQPRRVQSSSNHAWRVSKQVEVGVSGPLSGAIMIETPSIPSKKPC